VRAGLRTIIIPAANFPEVSEIPEHVRSKINIVPAKTMREILDVALVRPPRRPPATPRRPAATSRARGPSARA
jgi:ATP-dependent Lon protease